MTGLTLVRRIKARPSIVFEALIRPEEIVQWWGPDAGPVLIAEIDARIGGRFKVRFRMLNDSEHEATGTYLEVAPPHRLKMTWRWTGGEEDPGESELSFVLREIPEGTELTLTHALLHDEPSAMSHEEGWSESLDKLVAMFER